ncbi:MAG: hypothetical protein WHV44_16360 [Anaerolineales bacterium]
MGIIQFILGDIERKVHKTCKIWPGFLENKFRFPRLNSDLPVQITADRQTEFLSIKPGLRLQIPGKKFQPDNPHTPSENNNKSKGKNAFIIVTQLLWFCFPPIPSSNKKGVSKNPSKRKTTTVYGGRHSS